MSRMPIIDREGIFMALPLSWGVKESAKSQALAISIEFLIKAQLGDDGEWASWEGYEDHRVFGDFWVVKSDGTVNSTTVKSLAESLAWSGDLTSVENAPPAVDVQITVKGEEYNGSTYFKASWMNPADYTPQPPHISDDAVREKNARFGSLLRAAASEHLKAAQPKYAPAPAPKEPPHPADSSPTDPTADLPF